jgi:hypothetical protein
MTSGIGGSGPVGPGQGPGPAGEVGEAGAAAEAPGAPEVGQAGAAAEPDAVARLAADLDAGRITPEQALAQLIDGSVAGMPAADAAELRSLLEDLVAADPYLGGLLGGG